MRIKVMHEGEWVGEFNSDVVPREGEVLDGFDTGPYLIKWVIHEIVQHPRTRDFSTDYIKLIVQYSECLDSLKN